MRPLSEGLGYLDMSGCLSWNDGERIPGTWVIPLGPGEQTAAGEPGAVPVVVTVEDLQRLPIAPGTVSVQPARGWVLVNVDTIAYTDAATQILDTVVLGTPVRVEVTPVDYTWDFGDGSAPVTTTHPGAPWPEHTVAHPYTRAAEQVRVTLTTRWAGRFDVAGTGVWQPVQGLATTTAASAPFAVRTAEVSLTG